MTCPNCDHDDHEGLRCTGTADEGFHACACSWPDPGNFTETTARPRDEGPVTAETRQTRWNELIETHDLVPGWDEPDAIERFALIERNNGSAGGWWITTHATKEDAADSCGSEDYEPSELVDLTTGETFEPVTTITWR